MNGVIKTDYKMGNERDSVVIGIVEKSKSLDFSIMLVFWPLISLVRNSMAGGLSLIFVFCFFTVHGQFAQIHYLAKKRLPFS